MVTKRMIDPPRGWEYGFPKEAPPDGTDTLKWLVEQGYPQKLIDELGRSFYCSYFYVEENT